MTFSRRRLLIIGAVVLAVLGLVVFAFFYSNTTYVRIVDMSSIPNDTSSAPGADINAVGLLKKDSTNSLYATKVVSSDLHDGSAGVANESKDASSIVGSPDDDQAIKYVSLGIGGSIVAQLNAPLRAGDQLTVYEIGIDTGPHAEYYEVFTSKKPNGPWKSLGTAAGPHTFSF
jgi:hypothetical protein